MKTKPSSKSVRSKSKVALPKATIQEAVQERITQADHSSMIPGTDLNEMKRSLDLLKYALDYSEAIVDTVQVPLIMLDKNLRILTANRSFYETFKLSPKETEKQLIYELSDKAWNILKLKTLLEKILPTNSHFDKYEVEIDLPRIGRRVLLLNARKVFRPVNSTDAMLLAFEDITDRKLLEVQKDNFIGTVSHELKTPLTSIKVYAELLENHQKQKKDKRAEYFLSKMTEQMERLTQMMASFVNVYKIQTGELSLHKKTFDINELISKEASDFQYTTKSHTVDHDSQAKTEVYADKVRIAQVLINLITNAVKYSPNADKVIVQSSQEKDTVTVSIQDFGLGIPKKEQVHIFDRFFRVQGKRTNNISGLGLGLYISSEIIKQHKGKIWCESIEGKGSTFHFTLPIK